MLRRLLSFLLWIFIIFPSVGQTHFKTEVSVSKAAYIQSIRYELFEFTGTFASGFRTIDQTQIGNNISVGERFIFKNLALTTSINYKFFGTKGYRIMDHYLGIGVSLKAGNDSLHRVRFVGEVNFLTGFYSPSKNKRMDDAYPGKVEWDNKHYGQFYYSSPFFFSINFGMEIKVLEDLRLHLLFTEDIRISRSINITWKNKEDIPNKLKNTEPKNTDFAMMGLKLGLVYLF